MELGLLLITLGAAVLGGGLYPRLAPPKDVSSPLLSVGGTGADPVRAISARPWHGFVGYIHFGLAAAAVIVVTAGAIGLSIKLLGQS